MWFGIFTVVRNPMRKKPFTASWVKQIKLQVGKSKRSPNLHNRHGRDFFKSQKLGATPGWEKKIGRVQEKGWGTKMWKGGVFLGISSFRPLAEVTCKRQHPQSRRVTVWICLKWGNEVNLGLGIVVNCRVHAMLTPKKKQDGDMVQVEEKTG